MGFRAKLGEAMSANKAWETRYNDLHRDLRSYALELEERRRLATKGDLDLSGFSGSYAAENRSVIEQLRSDLREERQTNSDLKRKIELMEAELQRAKEQTREDLRSKDRGELIHMREELNLMREQLQIYKQDFDRERADRARLEEEKNDLRHRLVVARQQASTSEANFAAAKREKEDLLEKVRSIARIK